MRRGGYFPQALERLTERYAFLSHGLTMSVGAEALAEDRFFSDIIAEINRVASPYHSDHLCLQTAGDQVLHELLPIPHTKKFAQATADQIRRVEDKLQRLFAVENISFYAHPVAPELSEVDFLCEVLRLSEAHLLLDVNNVYVNAMNHGFDPGAFIRTLPHDRIIQLHIAGHEALPAQHSAAGMLLDNHGTQVIEPVKQLLAETLTLTGPLPITLERDNNIPSLDELLAEVKELQAIYDASTSVPRGGVLEGREPDHERT